MLPPCLTIKSEANPSDGFAVIPEYESEPPHCNATVNSEIEISLRCIELISFILLITFFVT